MATKTVHVYPRTVRQPSPVASVKIRESYGKLIGDHREYAVIREGNQITVQAGSGRGCRSVVLTLEVARVIHQALGELLADDWADRPADETKG